METLSMLMQGFAVAGTPENLMIALIGCFIGTVVGLLPGLGPINGVAILLPIAFAMKLPPESALILLCAVYAGCEYGGRISAILINVPGDAGAVMTTLDGYPLAKKGLAGPALSMSALASFTGALLATIGIVAFAPLLAEWAIAFGPAEYFALMVLALSCLGGLVGDSLPKAMTACLIGLLLSTVGIDANSGVYRYTFDMLHLQDGIPFIVIVIGLFAVSELMLMLQNEHAASERDLAHDRQPEPAALAVALAEDAVEAVKDALALGHGDARALVADADHRLVVEGGDGDGDRRVGRAVADRVVDQVGHHFAQHRGIAFQGQRVADALVGEVDVALERERGELHRHLLDQAGKVEGGALADHAVDRFGVRQGQHLVGQPACGARASEQAGEGLQHFVRIGLAQAVLGLGGQHRERGADLVRGVGEEALARGEHRRQALHVVVDGVDQRRDLARHALEAHRGQVLLVALADVVADAQQRAEGGAERGQHQQRADRHQQGLALQAGDEQIPRQRPARAGGLGEHDQHRVAAGKLVLAYNVLGSYAHRRARNDPALGVALPRDYTLVLSRVAFIARGARHPAAARLWLDHLLSTRGQALLAANLGLLPVRTDAGTAGADSAAALLHQNLQHAFRPIRIGSGLLAYQDQAKKDAFLRQWDAATRPVTE